MKSALDFLAGSPCGSPIGGGITAQVFGKVADREPGSTAAPSKVQREIPGFF